MAKHSLSVEDCKKVRISGVKGVESLSEKEAEILLDELKLILRGEKLNASQLNVEEGVLAVEGERIDAILYQPKNKVKFHVGKWFQ